MAPMKKTEQANGVVAAPAEQQPVQQPQQQQPKKGAKAVPAEQKQQQKQQAPPAENGNEAAGEENGVHAKEEMDAGTNERFAQMQEQLALIGNAGKALTSSLKALERDFKKMVKLAQKGQHKKRKGGGADGAGANGAKRAPSGFAKPAKLSNELCKFLGVAEGTEMARTEVTRRLNAYIRENQLQDQQDKRTINPDAKLKAILDLKDGQKPTYFNLQSFIKHHFVKADEGAPAPAQK